MIMANRVTGTGKPKQTVLQVITTKLEKLNGDMKDKAAVIKVATKRKLTPGEIAMSQLIFSDAIDYSKVWIHLGGIVHTRTGNAMTPAGEIYLPKDDYLKTPDYSKATGEERHWFIHEMAHVWQYQMGVSTGWLGIKQFCRGGYTSEVESVDSGKGELKAYDTDLIGRDLNKKFQDFNFEQQGRIIEFWFDAMYLQHLNPNRNHHQKSLKLQGYLERILRDFLLNPHDKKLLPKL
jgi:type VI secretion system secreted protein VgrG